MEEERFAPHPPSRENPRPATSGIIVDRFRALARDNEEIVQVYEELLSELTFNSKPIITDLTIIAGEQREHGEGIAEAICARILQVPVDQKLPSLYLLDSIVKNIGREYVRYFATRLPKVFCEAYNQVYSNMHPSMRHLFGTWSQVFPPSVLRKIEDELQFSTTETKRPAGQANMRNSESPSPRPSHGIHVNPKYLEAQRQLQHSANVGVIDNEKIVHTVDIEEDIIERLATESPKGWSRASPKFHDTGQAGGNSSRLRGYGPNSSVQYGDYDFNKAEVLSPHLPRSKSGSPQTAALHTSVTGVEGPVLPLNANVTNPLSPSRVRLRRSASPIENRLPRDDSPWRAADRASQPHSRLGFGLCRAVDQNSWLERSWPPDVGLRQLEVSTTYDPDAGYSKKHPRELIDAYGNYRGKGTSLDKLPKLQRINVNGINREASTKNWRSFEEEEYVWEDMSPTLADRSRRNSLPPLGPSSGSLSRRIGLSRPDANILEPDFRGNNWHEQTTKLHPVDDPAIIVDDRIPVLGSGHGSMHIRPSEGKGGQNEQFHHYRSPHHVQEPGKFPYNFQHAPGELSSTSRGWRPQMPVPVAAGNGQKLPSSYDNPTGNGQKLPTSYSNSPNIVPYQSLPNVRSNTLTVETSMLEKHLELRPFSPPAAPAPWPVHKSQSLPLLPVPSYQRQFKSPFSLMESNKPFNQGHNPSLFPSLQQFESADRETTMLSKVLSLPQQAGLTHTNQQRPEQGDGMRTQSQEGHGGYIPSVPAHLSSPLLAQPLNHVQMQGQGVAMGPMPNKISSMASSGAMQSKTDTSSRVHGIMPPLPPGPPPGSSHMEPASQNTGSNMSGSPVSAFSGLISTLMAQGLITLPPAQSEDTVELAWVGLEFNAELLKARHDSAINGLYEKLPRQCKTCGLRFKCQDEHSNHMDWHVTKNRISRNRKQKPSRKWFVNTKEWLSGAETVGTDVIPFLPTEIVVEKMEDKEMAVPADENQTVCALCGELFDDFYSDEAEEWMYKGAVYLNAPNGNVDGMVDKSQLGPIIHAKCRSASNEGS